MIKKGYAVFLRAVACRTLNVTAPTYGEMAQIVTQITGIVALESKYDMLMCLCKNFRLSYDLFCLEDFFFNF